MSIPGFFAGVPHHRLPHPAIPLRVILVTHLALLRAFQLLREDPPEGFQLATAKEDEITRQLQFILENRLLRTQEVPGFDSRRIKNVVRAPEVANYDNKHPAKKPDLVLFLLKRESLAVLSSHDGIFAECKPVDEDHPIGTHYCDLGVMRFIVGDYAWTMQEGMLIAFVRGGRTVQNDLKPVLMSKTRHAQLGSCDEPTMHQLDNGGTLHSTVHRRGFLWPADAGPACDIRLFHSWHDCS